MTINFYLANKNMPLTSIVVMVTIGNKRLRLGSSESIENPAKNWDEAKQQARRSYFDAFEINRRLQELASRVQQLHSTARALNHDPLQFIKAEFKKEKVGSVSADFFDHFNSFIETNTVTKTLGTIKVYKTTYNYLQGYQTKSKKKIYFDTIDNTFSEKFIQFLFEEKKLTNNTVSRSLRTLKTFMNWSLEQKLHTNINYQKIKAKALEEEATTIALTESEVQQIEELDLSKHPFLTGVRDVFLIGVYTGLRYSDLQELKPENFGSTLISIRVRKTKENLSIPITPRLQKIMNKYPRLDFSFISSQKFNEHLKELAQLAEINTPVEIIRYRGTERVSTTVPKSEVVTSHTARRTFITISLQKGIPAELIMKVSGHNDYKSFQKYVRMSQHFVADEMSRVWQ